jgi:hypothetical protein
MLPPSVTPANVLVAVVGPGLLTLSAWCWAGRSRGARWWAGRPFGPQLMLGVVPGLGLIALSVGVVTLAGTSVALVVVLPFLFGALLELAGMLDVLPRWWGPGWYRDLLG